MSIITISRGTKSSGLELANRLSEKLGYTTLSMEEVIAESARKYNIMNDILLDKLEKTPSLWQKFTNDYARYIIFIQCALLAAIKKDNVIYHGYAGQVLLKGLSHVLKLRIEAPLAYRVNSVKEEFNYNNEKAITYINKVDMRRKKWIKMVYNEDWYNPSLYDLWVNLQNMSMDNICELVSMAVNHKDFKSNQESIRQLDNLSLKCEVQAALATDNTIWNSQQITVNAYDGVVILKGAVKNRELKDLIVDTTLKVKGVKDCKSDISLLSDELH
jgi:cytidylate kinase